MQFRIPSAYTNSEYAVGVVGTALSVVGCVPDRDVVVDTTDWLHNYSEAIRREQQGVLWVGLLWSPRYTRGTHMDTRMHACCCVDTRVFSVRTRVGACGRAGDKEPTADRSPLSTPSPCAGARHSRNAGRIDLRERVLHTDPAWHEARKAAEDRRLELERQAAGEGGHNIPILKGGTPREEVRPRCILLQPAPVDTGSLFPPPPHT